MTQLYVTRIVSSDSSNGPSLRTSLYLSMRNGKARSVEDVFEELKTTRQDISILGDEPLTQWPALIELCKMIKKRTKRKIRLWTEYELPTIRRLMGDILRYVDTLIEGPYREHLRDDKLPFRGSFNQQIWEISHGKTISIIHINDYL